MRVLVNEGGDVAEKELSCSEITDFNSSVANNSAVLLNTSKVSNVTHTGDVTGSGATTIVANAVTNSKLADMPSNTMKGRVSSNGDPQDLTAVQVRSLLNVADGANNYTHPGTHPASVIVQDTAHRFVSDTEKTTWNAKSNLALGETYNTAYRGDKGKTAYDHSQSAHAPSNAQKNSDITKAEIEAKLTGTITSHSHNYEPADATILKESEIINTLTSTLTNKPLSAAQGKILKDLLDSLSIPPGTIWDFAGTTAPSGWLLCAGQAVSRSAYSALFSAIGTRWGAGNGSTTFNLPDFRGRFSLGADNMGGTSANRVTSSQADNIGQGAGEENHTLTTDEMPSHNHYAPVVMYSGVGGLTGAPKYSGRPDANMYTGYSGNDQPHNNMPPYATILKIIKA